MYCTKSGSSLVLQVTAAEVVSEYELKLIPQLRGLHKSLSLLNVIGKHIECCVLADVWVESDVPDPNSCDQVIAGKSYKRAMRANKLILQALWRL